MLMSKRYSEEGRVTRRALEAVQTGAFILRLLAVSAAMPTISMLDDDFIGPPAQVSKKLRVYPA